MARVLLLMLCLLAAFVEGSESWCGNERDDTLPGVTVGIDLGSATTCAAWYEGDRVHILPSDRGARVAPSCMFLRELATLVGVESPTPPAGEPLELCLYGMKRILGLSYDNPVVQEVIKELDLEVLEVDNFPRVKIVMGDEVHLVSPEHIVAAELSQLKEGLLRHRELSPTEPVNAVLTVPAYFADSQRQALHDAGRLAGLNVLRIINEPTCASLAYALDAKGGETNVLVVDVGWGTYDVSVLTIDSGVFEVIASDGDSKLGGRDFDEALLQYLLGQFKKRTGKDASIHQEAVDRLRRQAEIAKKRLSVESSVSMELEEFLGEDFHVQISRAQFEQLSRHLFKRLVPQIRKALRSVELEPSEIHEIVLIGGASRMPKLRQLIHNMFGGKEPMVGLNADEAVAYGAAVQANIIAGVDGVDDLVCLCVIALSVGVETEDGLMEPIIGRNSMYPAQKTKTVSVVANEAGRALLRVFEGERALVQDCHLLTELLMEGLSPGRHLFSVTLEIPGGGCCAVNPLVVSATDLESGRQFNVTLLNNEAATRSSEEIERMIKEAEEMAEEDKKLRGKSINDNLLKEAQQTSSAVLF